MKKTILLFITLLAAQFMTAQNPTIYGSEEYGRLWNFCYDATTPNKIYALTQRNHIVVSADNGENWKVLYSFPNCQMAVIDLKYNKTHTLTFTVENTLYVYDLATQAIVREYHLPVPQNADEVGIASYDIYMNDINWNYVIVHQVYDIGGAIHAKVYYTQNGGAEPGNWDEIYFTGNYGRIFPVNVAISPSNNQKLFITRQGGLDPQDYGGLFKSDNAGVNWTELYSGINFARLVFDPRNPNKAFLGTCWLDAAAPNLYRSFDGGDSWTTVSDTWANETPNGINSITFNPSEPETILIMGKNEIVRTYNDFQTWETVHHPYEIENPDAYFFGMHAAYNPYQPNELFMSANDYPLFSADGGITFARHDNRFFQSYGGAGLFDNGTESHLYYGLQNGYVHRNMTTGVETPHFVQPLGFLSNFLPNFMNDPKLQGRMYAFSSSFQGSGLAVFDNHGENMSAAFPIGYTSSSSIVSLPGNPDLLWGAFSNDYSNSDLLQIDISDPDNITQNPIALPGTGLLNGIWIDPNNSASRKITLGHLVFSTADSGVTWTNTSTGLESLTADVDKINCLTQNPLAPNQFTIATTKGIFTSLDNGMTWVQKTDQKTEYVAHSTQTNGHWVAAAYNRTNCDFALTLSGDSGENWLQVPAEELLHLFQSTNIVTQFTATTADVYIATLDLGVVKYTIDFSTLGLPDNTATQNELALFPNPANNSIEVLLGNQSIDSIEIYDLLGKRMQTKLLTENRFDISMLAAGMYQVKVKTSQAVYSSKLLKK